MGVIKKNIEQLALNWRLRPYRIDAEGSNMLDLSAVGNRTDRIETWSNFTSEIEHYAKKYDPCTFLTWPPIRKSMVARGAMVDVEFDELRRAANWTDYAPVLMETTVGMPEPYRRMPSTSSNLIHHAYHVYRFELSRGRQQAFSNVIEFGGGYGSMCRLLAGYAGFSRYTIFDLPHLSAVQNYFLANVLNNGLFDRVHLASDIGDIDLDSGVDLFVSTWALSEVPLSLRRQFEPIIAKAKNVLLAYQATIDGIDNTAYFEKLAGTTSHAWEVCELNHKLGNFYMFGSLTDGADAGDA